MARERFVSFNLTREQIFSVNLARRLEKLPTPGLDSPYKVAQIFLFK